jgi:hypothetical protein
MGGNNFDVLMQEIRRHKRIMEQLEEENRELRRQLADLREARGIYVEICGKRFALMAESTPAPALVTPIPAPTSYSTPVPAASAPGVPASQKTPPLPDTETDVTESPTIAMPQTPRSVTQPLEDEEEGGLIPTFLEEIMMDEFAAASAASTSPSATWTPPANKQQGTDEDEKETLRRQLMGSFLLE